MLGKLWAWLWQYEHAATAVEDAQLEGFDCFEIQNGYEGGVFLPQSTTGALYPYLPRI